MGRCAGWFPNSLTSPDQFHQLESETKPQISWPHTSLLSCSKLRSQVEIHFIPFLETLLEDSSKQGSRVCWSQLLHPSPAGQAFPQALGLVSRKAFWDGNTKSKSPDIPEWSPGNHTQMRTIADSYGAASSKTAIWITPKGQSSTPLPAQCWLGNAGCTVWNSSEEGNESEGK